MTSYPDKDLSRQRTQPAAALARVSRRYAFRCAAAVAGTAATVAFAFTAASFVPESAPKQSNDQIHQYVPSNTGKNEAVALLLFFAAAGSALGAAYAGVKASNDKKKLQIIKDDVEKGMFWNKAGLYVSPDHYDPEKDLAQSSASSAPQAALR